VYMCSADRLRGDVWQAMIPSRCVGRMSWCYWTAVKCFKRNPRIIFSLITCTVILVLFLSPGYQPTQPCQLDPTGESLIGAKNVTFGHLVLNFGRNIHLRLFAGSDQPNSSIGHGAVKLSAVIGRTLLPHAAYRLAAKPNRLRLIFPGVRLSVLKSFDGCYRITWKSYSGHLRDSIRLSGAHWYGGPTVYEPRWPTSELRRPGRDAMVTGDVYKDYYGGVVERFWISSKGAVVHVDYDVPLFVTMNRNDDGNLDIEARSARDGDYCVFTRATRC